MNILLVDDDAIDREIVKRALRSNDEFSFIHEVSSAEEGLRVADEGDFDVLLLDYKMPKTNGIEMIIELRKRPNLGKTAIVMVSASDDEALALSCIEAGAQDFITKNEISASKLKRAIVQAKKRFELEKKLYDSFCQVRELAEKDSLTGLANRYHFEEALKVLVVNNKRSHNHIALFMLDLDHFKNVNDTYGHDTGDQLLKQVTLRIKQCLRGNELFGRLGGDEFAILITGLKLLEDTTVVAQRIIQSLDMPFHIDGHHIQCSVSIGIAMYPHNTNSAETLTKYADIAMYRAKKQGRNQLCYFEKSMQEQFSRKYKVESELKKTIKNKGFELHFQPVINAINNQLIGFEALLRWPNCALKSTPDEFIPIAEKSRLIIQIGEWVVEQAIKQLSLWKGRFHLPLTMAINISTVQLGEESFIIFLKLMLEKYHVAAKSVILEFTETALLERDEKNNQCIKQLYDLGCTLALDDFGTGFSSLSHLLNYPIDIVKLDKSLLPQKTSDQRHLAIVKGLAAMVNTIGLRIIAEGVETQFQYDLCAELSIDELQGFYFDKALPAEDVEKKWLAGYLM
jgi:diguanylate cyclase (GGDEF)-like protein